MDLQHEGMSVCIEKLQKTDALKTGKLIYAACALGCVAAGADEEKLNEYFCHEIMSGELHDFRFSLDF